MIGTAGPQTAQVPIPCCSSTSVMRCRGTPVQRSPRPHSALMPCTRGRHRPAITATPGRSRRAGRQRRARRPRPSIPTAGPGDAVVAEADKLIDAAVQRASCRGTAPPRPREQSAVCRNRDAQLPARRSRPHPWAGRAFAARERQMRRTAGQAISGPLAVLWPGPRCPRHLPRPPSTCGVCASPFAAA